MSRSYDSPHKADQVSDKFAHLLILNMIPLEEAQNYVLETVQRLGTERVGLLNARDRVASEPIISSESIPPFDIQRSTDTQLSLQIPKELVITLQ